MYVLYPFKSSAFGNPTTPELLAVSLVNQFPVYFGIYAFFPVEDKVASH